MACREPEGDVPRRPGGARGDDPTRKPGAIVTDRLHGQPDRWHGRSAAYTASKGGVVALTKSIARYGGPHGITANCVLPGVIDTDMTRAWTGRGQDHPPSRPRRSGAWAPRPRWPRSSRSWSRRGQRLRVGRPPGRQRRPLHGVARSPSGRRGPWKESKDLPRKLVHGIRLREDGDARAGRQGAVGVRLRRHRGRRLLRPLHGRALPRQGEPPQAPELAQRRPRPRDRRHRARALRRPLPAAWATGSQDVYDEYLRYFESYIELAADMEIPACASTPAHAARCPTTPTTTRSGNGS